MTSARLHTLSVGASGPRVAFLHGLFGQGRNWSQIAKALAGPTGEAARCLLVDLPDHGRSPWSDHFSLQAYAASVASTLRDQIMHKWVHSKELDNQEGGKRVYYLSIEFLLGRAMFNNALNLLSSEVYTKALTETA